MVTLTTRAAGALLILLACACAPAPERRLDDLYATATTELARGQLQPALQAATEGVSLATSEKRTEWIWRFMLLRAEVALTDGQLTDATAAVTQTVPSSPSFDAIRARQQYLNARLLVAKHALPEARTALITADRLASSASARELALDIGVVRGRVEYQLGEWDVGDATLAAVTTRAQAAGDVFRVAMAANNLGMGHIVRSRFDEALPYFERVLAFESLKDRLVYANALTNAGVCLAQLGEFDRAARLQMQAIAAHERSGATAYLAQAVGELGNTYVLQGTTDRAVPFLQRALDLAIARNQNADAALRAENLASAFTELSNWDRARRTNEQARALNARLQSQPSPYCVLNDGWIAAGSGRRDEAAARFHEAIKLAGDDPSLEWLGYAGLAHIARVAGDSRGAARSFEAALRVIERTQSGLGQIDYKLSYLTRLIRFYREYVDVLIDAGQRERALEIADSSRARVLAERAGASVPARRTSAEFKRVAQASGTVLVAYWLGSDRSFAWVVNGAAVHVATLPPASRIESLVADYQRLVVDGAADPLAMATTPGDALFAAVVAPIQPYLTLGRPIVLVPDGALHTVNFETLPVPGPRRHYWLEDVTIAVAPSLATLQPPVKAGPAQARTGASVLLVGNAVATDPRFPPLHFAGEELTRIATHFAPASVTRQEGSAATPRAYFAAKPERFDILHFAAHASTSRETPLDSTVILSADRMGYKLYAREVAEHPLHADLVTISACRSAGERLYSGEGLVGFAWAFLRAGARRVVAGLWDVDDRSTVSVMDRLYTGIAAGQPPVTALRDAKLALVRGGGVYAKPYYWAPFQLFTVTADR